RCSTARKGRDRHVLRDRVRGSGGAVCRCSLLCTPPRGQHYLRPVDSPAGPIRVGTAGARPVAVPRTLVPRLDRGSGLRRRDALYVPVGRGGDREGALCGGGDVPVPWCPASRRGLGTARRRVPMVLSPFLARLAVQATRVLVVEAPGQWATRMELEQQLLRRGWRIASSPAQGDVLVVCGAPGPELSDLANRLWEQMPGPRVRIGIASPGAVVPALDNATALLLDTSHHRTDARERAQEPSMSDHANNADGEGHEG